MEFGAETILALGAVALVAGFFDAIAGGGGLVTVPALLLAGFDPVTAIATNKLQGSFGTASAVVAFGRAGRIDWRKALPMAALAAVGGVGGALAVRTMPTDALAAVIPLLLVVVALYFGLSPRISDADATSRIGAPLFAGTVVPVVGFYDGFFGPGAGSFYMAGLVTLLGYGLLRATATTKVLNVSSNVGSLVMFAAAGLVVWPVGLVMGAAALVGAQLGSRMALRFGARLIRPLLVIVCCAVAVRLMMNPDNPLRVLVVRTLTGG